MSYFTLKYGFTSLTCCDEPTPGCADIWPRQRNRRGSISVTMLWVPSKFFRKFWQNSKHDCHFEGKWTIGIHFRWPCLSDFLCMLGGSSDLCRLLPVPVGFGRANYAVTQHATGQWQTVSTGVHVCVSSSKQKESHLGNPGVGIGQFIAFVIYRDSFYEIIHKCFNFSMLEGVLMIVRTKTKWWPSCWNRRFGTFWCYTGTVTIL